MNLNETHVFHNSFRVPPSLLVVDGLQSSDHFVTRICLHAAMLGQNVQKLSHTTSEFLRLLCQTI